MAAPDHPHDPEALAARVRALEAELDAARAREVENAALRARAERNERVYRELFDTMVDGYALFDVLFDAQSGPADLRFRHANAALEPILGVSAAALVGQLARDAAPDVHAGLLPHARAALAGDGLDRFDLALGAAGLVVQVRLWQAAPGQLAATFTDVTERARAEQERQRLDEHIQKTQRLESLGVLAGGVAHDFNNLLTAILGHTDLALSTLSQMSPARDELEHVVLASRRASELCRQMLAYSGQGTLARVELDVAELVREMAPMLEAAVTKRAILRFALAPELPVVRGDPSQLRQVVTNLVINASEAIGDGHGVVVVKVGMMHCDRPYLSETWVDDRLPDGAYIYIEVSDTGVGMDRATQSRIFEPFFSTKFTGRGLGLSATIGIVRGHCGALRVYSEPRRGTTIKVLFPVAEAAEVRAGRDPHLPAARLSGTVLLADDEAPVRLVATRMLEKLGFQVLQAADGDEAVRLFIAHADEITCVILDLTMPKLDGDEAFRAIRRLRPDVPVMLCSGYSESELAPRLAGRSRTAFMQKPYRLDALSLRLRDVLGPDGRPR